MKKSITRRVLIGSLIIPPVLVALGWYHHRAPDLVSSIINRRLSKLNLTKIDVSEFANEYVLQRQAYKSKLRILSTFSMIVEHITPYSILPMDHPLRRLEDNIISNFLLSTNFFDNNEDTSLPLEYLGFYDPYKIPCRNLFSAN